MSNLVEGIKAVPIRKAYAILNVGPVTGQALVNSGALQSFTIGTRRYATPEAIDRFIRQRLAASAKETPEQRAAKVAPAVAAMARKRAEAAA